MEKVDFSLNGKIALVTGASRGIGEAIAITLADYGAHCILVSRKADALAGVAEKIASRGGKAEVMACHVGDLKQIEGLFAGIKERHGKLHILINNAATNPYFGEMLGADEGIWNKTFDVNLKGPFFLIQHAAKLMMESGGGSVVNVSSINGVKPAPFQGVYSITKAGLISMTHGLCQGACIQEHPGECAVARPGGDEILPGHLGKRDIPRLRSQDDTHEQARAAHGDRRCGVVPRIGCSPVHDRGEPGSGRRGIGIEILIFEDRA